MITLKATELILENAEKRVENAPLKAIALALIALGRIAWVYVAGQHGEV